LLLVQPNLNNRAANPPTNCPLERKHQYEQALATSFFLVPLIGRIVEKMVSIIDSIPYAPIF